MGGTSERYNKNYPVTWEQIQRDCRALAWKLLDVRSDWNRIIAIARGGLVPAAIIARELDIHHVDTICVSSYTIREQGGMSVLKRPDLVGADDSWLIIDDLVDTGKTAMLVREMFENSHFATVYAKPEGRPLVDTFITEVSQDTWVLFPWDTAPTSEFIPPIIDMGKQR